MKQWKEAKGQMSLWKRKVRDKRKVQDRIRKWVKGQWVNIEKAKDRQRVMVWREGDMKNKNNQERGQNNINALKWFVANTSVDCDGCLVSHQTEMRIHLGVIKFHRPPRTCTKTHTFQLWLVWSVWATYSLSGRAAGIIIHNDTHNEVG